MHHNLCLEQTYGSVSIWLIVTLILFSVCFFLLWLLLCYHQCAERRYHNVSGVWNGCVDSPEPHLISHEVDVGGASPAVGEGVVVAGSAQAALEQHAARAEVILHLERHTSLLHQLFSDLCLCFLHGPAPTRMLLWCLL